MAYAVIRQRSGSCSVGLMHPSCRHRTRPYANNRIESDHRSIKRRLQAMQGPRSIPTARKLLQAVEAAHMIRKGQVLGITCNNLSGQAWVFGRNCWVCSMTRAPLCRSHELGALRRSCNTSLTFVPRQISDNGDSRREPVTSPGHLPNHRRSVALKKTLQIQPSTAARLVAR